eukprot:51301-Eustigmatos_ZCMA.PRE.1
MPSAVCSLAYYTPFIHGKRSICLLLYAYRDRDPPAVPAVRPTRVAITVLNLPTGHDFDIQ